MKNNYYDVEIRKLFGTVKREISEILKESKLIKSHLIPSEEVTNQNQYSFDDYFGIMALIGEMTLSKNFDVNRKEWTFTKSSNKISISEVSSQKKRRIKNFSDNMKKNISKDSQTITLNEKKILVLNESVLKIFFMNSLVDYVVSLNYFYQKLNKDEMIGLIEIFAEPFNNFDIPNDRLLCRQDFESLLNKRKSFLNFFIKDTNIKYRPNYKYKTEFFEFTAKQHLYVKKTKTQAALDTMEKYPDEIKSFEGYLKQYGKYLNQKYKN